MKHTISSTAQSAFKMLVLVITTILVTTLIGTVPFSEGPISWGALFMPCGLIGLFLWLATMRKTVQMDEHFLYISVFRRVVAVPLHEITAVTEEIGGRDRTVTVRFRCDTPWGHAITFTPTVVFNRDPHPIVAELLAYAQPLHNPGETYPRKEDHA